MNSTRVFCDKIQVLNTQGLFLPFLKLEGPFLPIDETFIQGLEMNKFDFPWTNIDFSFI